MLFPQSALDAMAAESERNLPFNCDVQAPGTGVDARGAPTENVYASVFTTKCRTAPVTQPTEGVSADVLQSVSVFLVVFPRGTDVRENHRLVVTGTIAGIPFTQTLDVIGVRGPRANEVQRSVVAKELAEPAT